MTQNKGYYGSRLFKVTDFGTNRKPICDSLLVINRPTNLQWHPISYRFEVIAYYCSNFEPKAVTLRFWVPIWGLKGNVRSS